MYAEIAVNAAINQSFDYAVPPELAARIQAGQMVQVPFGTAVQHGIILALRETTERLCAEAGFTPRIGFEGDEVETLRGLVTAGLGVSVLPLPHAAESPAPQLELTDVDAARDIGLAWAAGRTLPPLSETFRRHVLAAFDRPHGTM